MKILFLMLPFFLLMSCNTIEKSKMISNNVDKDWIKQHYEVNNIIVSNQFSLVKVPELQPSLSVDNSKYFYFKNVIALLIDSIHSNAKVDGKIKNGNIDNLKLLKYQDDRFYVFNFKCSNEIQEVRDLDFSFKLVNINTNETSIITATSWKQHGAQVFKSKTYSITNDYYTYCWFLDLGIPIEKKQYNLIIIYPTDDQMVFRLN